MKAYSERSSKVPQSWPQLVRGRASKTILEIYLKSSLVYLETWEGTKLGQRFKKLSDLWEDPGKAGNFLSPL